MRTIYSHSNFVSPAKCGYDRPLRPNGKSVFSFKCDTVPNSLNILWNLFSRGRRLFLVPFLLAPSLEVKGLDPPRAQAACGSSLCKAKCCLGPAHVMPPGHPRSHSSRPLFFQPSIFCVSLSSFLEDHMIRFPPLFLPAEFRGFPKHRFFSPLFCRQKSTGTIFAFTFSKGGLRSRGASFSLPARSAPYR